MDYQIIWSPEALNQLDDLVRFISTDNPAAAGKMGNAIIEKVFLLGQFPRMGKVFRKMARDDVREILVSPYRIIYQIHESKKQVSISTIWHGPPRARNPMNPSDKEISRCCPLCGKDDFIPYLQKENLSLVQCKNCSMIYANPVPAEMASGSFYNETHAPFYLSPDKLESDYASVRFERELKLFRRFCKSGNVLDVGCSTGAFLFQLQNRFPGNYDALGTDVSQPALEYAKSRGVKIVNESFLDFDFGEKHFDAITFWAVMEHLTNPKQFLDKAASLLKSGGHCFILVPNMKSLAVRILGGKYRYILPEHVNYFAPHTLQKISERQSAFEIVASGSMHFNPIVIAQDFRGRGEYVSDENRAALLKRTTSYKQNPLLQPVKWVYKSAEKILSSLNLADNLFIVLRKK